MNLNNRKIAKITLEFLAKKSWSSLSTEIIKKKSTLNSFNRIIKSKTDLLKNINKYFDYILSLEIKNLENSSKKDMIFEIIMMRFDILQVHRKAINSIYKNFKKNPKDLVFLLPDILQSIILIFKYAKIDTGGMVGPLKIKGIFIIYITTFFVWKKDNSNSLEKTMICLDNYLNRADTILKFIN